MMKVGINQNRTFYNLSRTNTSIHRHFRHSTKRRLGSENDGHIYNETVDNVYNTSEYHKDVDRNEHEYHHVFLK